MKKEKYHYNPSTMKFEQVETSLKLKILRIFGIGSGVIMAGVILYFAMDSILLSPQEKILQQRLSEVTYHMDNLASEYNYLSTEVDELQEKDANLHRMILGVEPIDENIWNGGTGGSDRYDYLSRNEDAGKIIKEYILKADILERKVEIQKKSLDTLEALAIVREDKLASIPSVKPVREDKLKRNLRSLSGFGIRLHPVHGVKKWHKGIDFTAPTGTEVIATGNGKVIRVESKTVGYGQNVVIDHGFGYHSLYAHMSQIDIELGQEVNKGQSIGKVGSTGTSTAPHLHYEVRINGKAVNPLDFCLDELSPSEYQDLVEKASIENRSFD